MIDLLILLSLNSIYIVGFHITTQEGEINNWVDKLLWSAPSWIKKPLYDCPTCMASVHSIHIYWVYHYWHSQINWHTALIYVVYMIGLCAVNTLIAAGIEFFRTNIKTETEL